MKIILSHSGKQHAYHVAKALKKQGCLERFYTSSYIRNELLQKYLIKSKNTYWTRRFVEGVSGDEVNSNWRFELKEVFLRKLQGKSPAVQAAVYDRDMHFDDYVAKRLEKESGTGFWGFQGSCQNSLAKAHDLGIPTVCELSIAHVTEAYRILSEETLLSPNWADSIDNLQFPAQYQSRLELEPHLATHVLAASKFTQQSLENSGVDPGKIIVLPLGFDMQHIPYKVENKKFGKRPLRLLYAGTVTQRKGIRYLLDAMPHFTPDEVELHIIGGIQGSGDAFRRHEKYYTYHSPISQQELFNTYQDYDALVLPTLFEGFGLVIVEAMAAGLPVITTANSIGPDVITDRQNGYIVPIRDSFAIQQAIGELIQLTPIQYQTMRQAARDAAMAFTWDRYAENLSQLLPTLFAQ